MGRMTTALVGLWSGEWFKDPNFKDLSEGRVQAEILSSPEDGKFLTQSLAFPAIAHILDRAEAQGIACHILEYK